MSSLAEGRGLNYDCIPMLNTKSPSIINEYIYLLPFFLSDMGVLKQHGSSVNGKGGAMKKRWQEVRGMCKCQEKTLATSDLKRRSRNKYNLFFPFPYSPCLHSGIFYMCACMPVSHVSCVHLCAPLWTIAHQTPLSMGFSRKNYWSRLPLLQGIFPSRGSNLSLLHLMHWQAGFYH